MRIGLGTGSTAIWAARRVAERLADGSLRGVTAVTTSLQTELEARALGIPVVTLNDASVDGEIDLTIDGADEVDPAFNLIKGGGGALLKEKIIAYASRRLIIIVDASKLSPRLGAPFPRPGRGGGGRAGNGEEKARRDGGRGVAAHGGAQGGPGCD